MKTFMVAGITPMRAWKGHTNKSGDRMCVAVTVVIYFCTYMCFIVGKLSVQLRSQLHGHERNEYIVVVNE